MPLLPDLPPAVRRRWRRWGTVILLGLLVGAAVARGGLLAGVALAGALPVAFGVGAIVRTPLLGLLATVAASFVGAGLSRYITAPTGLLVDACLALTLIAVLLQASRVDGRRLHNGLVAAVVIWMAYNALELANPEARSAAAWFFAVRGVALYLVVAVPLALLLLRTVRDLDRVLVLWLALSLAGVLWGLKQVHIGLDGGEQAWLSIPGNRTTHLLFGKLRVFSFYSDSGQFGAAMGHAGLVALILASGVRRRGRKLLLGVVGLLCIYGLLISGTRGAMAVPAVGGLAYLVVRRNVRVLVLGLALLGGAYGLLRFTHAGQGNAEIRRMRTAIVEGKENASLQVRLQNQQRLKAYLASRPFGGGVGSAGSWGQRFSPGTFLADMALDSWYVKIWAEQGIVGLWLHLIGLAYLLLAGGAKLWRVRDPALRQRLSALYAGLWGIAAASYGNQVLGQMPTGILVAVSLAALWLAPVFDAQATATAPEVEAPPVRARGR